jgi:hypothetical protein
MTEVMTSQRWLLPACACALLFTGCAQQRQPLYHWGDFQTVQYGYFKGDKGPEAGIVALEKVREEAKASGRNVPPGLQAHLGMLYGLSGRTDLFEQNLLAEKQSFPESSVYLDFLLKKNQKTEGAR